MYCRHLEKTISIISILGSADITVNITGLKYELCLKGRAAVLPGEALEKLALEILMQKCRHKLENSRILLKKQLFGEG